MNEELRKKAEKEYPFGTRIGNGSDHGHMLQQAMIKGYERAKREIGENLQSEFESGYGSGSNDGWKDGYFAGKKAMKEELLGDGRPQFSISVHVTNQGERFIGFNCNVDQVAELKRWPLGTHNCRIIRLDEGKTLKPSPNKDEE